PLLRVGLAVMFEANGRAATDSVADHVMPWRRKSRLLQAFDFVQVCRVGGRGHDRLDSSAWVRTNARIAAPKMNSSCASMLIRSPWLIPRRWRGREGRPPNRAPTSVRSSRRSFLGVPHWPCGDSPGVRLALLLDARTTRSTSTQRRASPG